MTSNRGGKESFILNLFESLKDDYECWFLVDQEIAYSQKIIDGGGHICRVPLRGQYPIGYVSALWRVFKKERFDAVWLNQTVINSIEPLVVARASGTPVRILHSHSSSNMGSSLTGFLHHVQRPFVGAFLTRRLACSDLAGKWFYPCHQFEIVPNAFDVQKFAFSQDTRERVRFELGLSVDTLTLIQVALIADVKNHMYTLEILRSLVSTGVDVRLLLVGDGPLRGEIEARVSALELGDHVSFLGLRSDVPDLLQAADVMLLPSKFEGLPYTVLEAQAAQLPSVVSAAVTTDVAVTPNVTFLSLDDSPEKWAQSVVDVAGNCERVEGTDPLVGSIYDAATNAELYRTRYLS